MTISIPERIMFCNCGSEITPLIRTYRNTYGICNCGNLIKTKRRLWFVHYTRALKEYYSLKLSESICKLSINWWLWQKQSYVHFVAEQEGIPSIYYLQYHIAWFVTARGGSIWRIPWKNVFFVQVQAKIRLEPGFRASYVEAREVFTARALILVPNARGQENRQTAYHVPVVEGKDSFNNW